MIVGLAVHGYCEEALQLFSEMESGLDTVRPNRVTFLGVLIACSHKGLVDKARWYFDHMAKQYKIMHDIKHYGCMVDLLSMKSVQVVLISAYPSLCVIYVRLWNQNILEILEYHNPHLWAHWNTHYKKYLWSNPSPIQESRFNIIGPKVE